MLGKENHRATVGFQFDLWKQRCQNFTRARCILCRDCRNFIEKNGIFNHFLSKDCYFIKQNFSWTKNQHLKHPQCVRDIV